MLSREVALTATEYLLQYILTSFAISLDRIAVVLTQDAESNSRSVAVERMGTCVSLFS